MTSKFALVAATAALLAGCAYGYDDARSPEAGTAGTLHQPYALNPAPVGPVDNTAAVGTKGVFGTDVPSTTPVYRDAYGNPVVVTPAPVYSGGTVYYDAYGRPIAASPPAAVIVRP
jgi:hypothetical protein